MELTRVNVLPKICSTFSICPIPLRYDTYSGCSFGCCYCFARPTVEHNRIKTDSDFSSLRGSNPTYLSKWLEKTINTDTAFTTPHRCAIQARFPIKIGVMADPFPCVEQTEHITYDTLKIFNAYDYPIQISTKNPELLSTYYQDFNNPNWVISVSLCSLDSDHLKQIEPNAPTLQSRLDGISKLTDMGASVFLRWQPFIFPYGLQFVEDYVDLAAKLNCKGIILES